MVTDQISFGVSAFTLFVHLDDKSHLEVRFAEHTLNMLNSVLHNLEPAENMFQKMISGTVTSERKERHMARAPNGKLLTKILADSRDV